MIAKLRDFVKLHQESIFLGGCILLVALTSFNVGRMTALTKTPLSITQGQEATLFHAIQTPSSADQRTRTSAPSVQLDSRVVASKNSDKYHFTWCSGAKRIKEENKMWFQTEAEAIAKGLTLAGNCTK